jgi:DNA (cytosine-5)-methyltransferase 1
MIKLGSMFDGSGGWPLSAELVGIEPVWASEIEKFPIEVTKKRFPNMKHLGDITKINGAEIEPVDIITSGSPCQDLSNAGFRKGLRHSGLGDEETTRSGLFMESVRIIKEMREATDGVYPRIFVWENVPGAFSSNDGDDFRIVLEEIARVMDPAITIPGPEEGEWANCGLIESDGWSMAWRCLDAQYWGVPQRRNRIFLVADFASGSGAEQILFKREGLQRDFEKIVRTWKDTAVGIEERIRTASRTFK